MAKQGIDLKQEMAKRLKDMEDLWRKEKEEANEAFQQERKVGLILIALQLQILMWQNKIKNGLKIDTQETIYDTTQLSVMPKVQEVFI